jgi:cell division topological specificity factor
MDFLMKFDFLQRLFGRTPAEKDNSRVAARDRLQVALVGDRSSVAPRLMDSVRRDLIEVLNRYMEIDVQLMTMEIKNENKAVSLEAMVPVRRIKRQASLPDECLESAEVSAETSEEVRRAGHPRKLKRDKKRRRRSAENN